jgi:hypothetical protein
MLVTARTWTENRHYFSRFQAHDWLIQMKSDVTMPIVFKYVLASERIDLCQQNMNINSRELSLIAKNAFGKCV